MQSEQTDEELARALRVTAREAGYSTDAFLHFAAALIRHHRLTTMPNLPPRPEITEEFILAEEHVAGWPDWSARLICAGCKLHQMVWPDGTTVTRLISKQRAVVGAEIDHPTEQKAPASA